MPAASVALVFTVIEPMLTSLLLDPPPRPARDWASAMPALIWSALTRPGPTSMFVMPAIIPFHSPMSPFRLLGGGSHTLPRVPDGPFVSSVMAVALNFAIFGLTPKDEADIVLRGARHRARGVDPEVAGGAIKALRPGLKPLHGQDMAVRKGVA